jgi:hypothetical protein
MDNGKIPPAVRSRYAVDRNGQQKFQKDFLSRARSAAFGGHRPLTTKSF